MLTEREKNAFGIASNEAFSDGTKTFTNRRLCAAIVDRPAFSGTGVCCTNTRIGDI